tara:strand:- start:377 stop:496 length:120 start_codon:yes stop_codon:yes gene_type:complete
VLKALLKLLVSVRLLINFKIKIAVAYYLSNTENYLKEEL